MIKLIIFDLDGTLLNTLQDLADCTNYVLRKYGYPEHPLEAYRYFVGDGIRKLIERAIPESERTPEKIDMIMEEFMPYYQLNSTRKTAPYEGIIKLLQTLNSQRILLAVASNKAHEAMAPLIKHYFPDISFAAVMGNRRGVPAKPDPVIVNDILQITGIPKNEAIYVGDTSVDMKTAEAAGLLKIGVLWGFRNKEELVCSGADYIVERAEEIVTVIKSLS